MNMNQNKFKYFIKHIIKNNHPFWNPNKTINITLSLPNSKINENNHNSNYIKNITVSLLHLKEQIKKAILEDILSDTIKKFPSSEKDLATAKEKGVKPKYFPWLAKILSNTQEPVNDIIPLLITFDKKQQAISQKFGSRTADINSYKTVGELSNQLEKLGKLETNKIKVNTDKLYEDDTWIVAFPRTTEESCKLGMNTTWCTARTQSQNLFLSYTARGENIFLFYVINKHGDPQTEPNSKISVGFVNGEPQFDKRHGGLTVNSANDGVTFEKFKEVVGEANSVKFLNLMKDKIKELGGKHPAQQEMDKIAGDVELFSRKYLTFKDAEARVDFADLVLRNPNITGEVLMLLSKDEMPFVRRGAAIKPNTPIEALTLLSKDEDDYVRRGAARNPNTPIEALTLLSKDEDDFVRQGVAINPNTPIEVLIELSKDEDYYIRQGVASNPKMPREALVQLSKDENSYIRETIARNPNTPIEILLQLSKDEDSDVRQGVARNPNTPIEILLQLSKDEDDFVRQKVAINPNTSIEILLQLSKDENSYVRQGVAINPKTPIAILLQLSKDEDYFVRRGAANNPNFPK
jgi:pentose-5-phosphate-3-epimerase